MINAPADPGKHKARFKLRISGLLLIICFVLLGTTQSFAQGSATVRYETKYEEPVIRPYVVGYFGLGEPADAAYNQVFTDALFRVGGGFGMRIYDFGIEVLIRRGGVEQNHKVVEDDQYDVYRQFYFSSTDIQLKFYGAPRFGKITIPAGIGFGMTNTTVDRGYAGDFDRFNGTGFYVGPFAGIEYQINESFNVSVEVEYAMSEANFGGNEVWQNQYGDYPGQISSTESNFWDTVGGLDKTNFDNGGVIASVKLTVFIPTFSPDK